MWTINIPLNPRPPIQWGLFVLPRSGTRPQPQETPTQLLSSTVSKSSPFKILMNGSPVDNPKVRPRQYATPTYLMCPTHSNPRQPQDPRNRLCEPVCIKGYCFHFKTTTFCAGMAPNDLFMTFFHTFLESSKYIIWASLQRSPVCEKLWVATIFG